MSAIGESTNLIYDECAYNDRVTESTSPMLYRLNPQSVHNCNTCLSDLGPRSSSGVSTTVGSTVAEKQKSIDIENILSNRNVRPSKCKHGKVNTADLNSYSLKHARICDNTLNPISSRLTHPSKNYKGMTINRFYDLHKNPQAPIYWNSAANTRLEARDNYVVNYPNIDNMNGAAL